ncbi:hypothetical protein [Thomasclavelia cocleata]|uniref:hypothetical protein n=1 Tax=Thomasclavelia cocleata TaxID=69824 RepID=UPI0024307C45|nr:hypothetical protein [Thomasclavelia cocleata]
MKEVKDNCIKILSISRFSHANNFDNIPGICKRILNYGIEVKWYLIGYGGEEELIRSKIKEYSMQGHVFVLDKKVSLYSAFTL